MFEKFEVPALFVAKTPVLNWHARPPLSVCLSVGLMRPCSFAYGKSSGLVLDIGGALTTATPVVDGYALKKCTPRPARTPCADRPPPQRWCAAPWRARR
jgi:actin-related protein